MSPPTLQSSAGRLLAAGGLAALLTFFVLQAAYPFFLPPTVARALARGPVPPGDEELAIVKRVHFQNVAALVGIAGGLLTAALAIAEGSQRRSLEFLLVGVSSGAAFGGLFGAVAGYTGQWLLEFVGLLKLGEPWRTIAAQAATCGIMGFGVGFGLTLPLLRFGAIGRGLVGGAAGGLLAGMAYCLLSFIAHVSWSWVGMSIVSDDILNRVIWLFTAAVCITAITIGLLRGSRAILARDVSAGADELAD